MTVFATARLHDDALPIGIDVGGVVIDSIISAGDFGFVYAANDPMLQRRVVLEEYFPRKLAIRHAGTQMRARLASDHATVAAGRSAFIEESRLLARVEHPGLVKVLAAFEANQTAYRVMPRIAGETLEQARRERKGAPDDAWLRTMMLELIEPLDALHRAGVVHGHLEPSQLLLQPDDDKPVLLGFGAAGRALEPPRGAFVPPELESDGSELPRGPWTDFYGIAALAWFAATGREPPADRRPAEIRGALDQALGPPADEQRSRERRTLADTIARALSAAPGERPQNGAEFRALLAGVAQPGADAPPAEEPDPAVRAAIAAALAAIPESAALARAAPVPKAATAPPAAPSAAPAATAPVAAAQRAAANDEGEGSAWVASRAPDFRTKPKPPLRSGRRTAFAWTAAVLLGAAVGAAAWRWDAWRDSMPRLDALSARRAPSPTQPAPAVPLPLPPVDDRSAEIAVAPPPAATTEPSDVERVPAPAAGPARDAPPESTIAAAAPEPAAPTETAPPVPAEPARKVAERPKPPLRAAAAPKPAPTPKRVAAATARPGSPRDACEGRMNFSFLYCMQLQCRRGEFSAHPQCREMRRSGEIK